MKKYIMQGNIGYYFIGLAMVILVSACVLVSLPFPHIKVYWENHSTEVFAIFVLPFAVGLYFIARSFRKGFPN